ncbi:MAG: nucleotidyl transferase AbiEii/AbiGii toxin family protein [Fidelibacterota bacterium]
MIPQAFITEWQNVAPWQRDVQIEQDLIISRILVEIFKDEFLRDQLLFRGGTALYKLFFKSPLRYSEDLDFVQKDAGPIKPIVEAIQQQLNPWLGVSSTDSRMDGFRIYYRFQSESDPEQTARIKVEINTREHFTVFAEEHIDYNVNSRWYQGKAEISSYHIDELAGTKLRALYQRKKGRDLFDLYELITEKMVNPKRVIEAFYAYLEHQNLSIDQKEFIRNLEEKLIDEVFIRDCEILLLPTIKYDLSLAGDVVKDMIRLLK